MRDRVGSQESGREMVRVAGFSGVRTEDEGVYKSKSIEEKW
jgi:hypothetical protein